MTYADGQVATVTDKDGALTQKTDMVNGTQTDYTASGETVSEVRQDNTLTEIYRRETR